MITFAPFKTEEQWEWLNERTPIVGTSDMKGIVAYKDDEIIGACALCHWTYNSVEIHIACDNMLAWKHGFKQQILDYVYQTAGRGVVVGLTPADNEDALRFNKHIGFTEIFRIKDGYKVDTDLVIQELRKEDYYGKISARSA